MNRQNKETYERRVEQAVKQDERNYVVSGVNSVADANYYNTKNRKQKTTVFFLYENCFLSGARGSTGRIMLRINNKTVFFHFTKSCWIATFFFTKTCLACDTTP